MDAEKSRADYRDMLSQEYENRREHRPHYSLRAFARDLKLSSASLNLILSGRQGLSAARAKDLAERMGFSASESEWFVLSVKSLHERKLGERAKAKQHLESERSRSVHGLSPEQFEPISQWFYLAILELTALEDFRADPRWIARKLGMEESRVKKALDRLIETGHLARKNGTLAPSTAYFATSSPIPSRTIRNYHCQILRKAEEAVLRQSVAERDLSSTILSMSDQDLEWAKEQLKKFRRKLVQRLESRPKKNRLYCLNTQFFNLLQEET